MARDVTAALKRVVAHLDGGGEVREGQAQMAEAVAEALERERHLVVRAGTGTGKSLGYLVPAVCSAKRVVVATATLALQDQLADKDLPLIAEALGRKLRVAVVKGRSNYLCRQRLREAEVAGTQEDLGLLAEPRRRGRNNATGEQVQALLEWAKTTRSGDRAELAEEPDAKIWGAFSVGAEECPGATRCPSGGDCFAETARAEASVADVVIVNLHLLGADVASDGAVLGEYDALVVDEAHALEDIVTESLGLTIGPGRVRALVATARSALGGRLRAEDDRALDDLAAAADSLEDALAGRSDVRIRPGEDAGLDELVGLLAGRVGRLESVLSRGADDGEAAGERSAAVTRTLLSAGKLREDLAELATLGDDEVAWVAGGARPAIAVAPIEVGPLLAEQLFAKRPVILTSATVPPRLGERLGAPSGRTDELDVGSPFAYEQHALLYCAAHLPDRRRPETEAAIHDELAALAEAAGGRTLALFTSRVAMERAVMALRERISYPILCQGEGTKRALLTAFAAEEAACLFATMGFWQGIDVAGSTLSLVVIDRIPFPRPDDPLITARRERAGAQAFRLVDLPRAAGLLAQGAGRLIRTGEDRGVVAVLDSRLASATYRWDLVRALPPMRRTKVRAEAEAFLAELRQAAEQKPPRPTVTSGRPQ